MCTAVEEKNTEAILTVMNTTELVVEIRPEKSLFFRFQCKKEILKNTLKTSFELL